VVANIGERNVDRTITDDVARQKKMTIQHLTRVRWALAIFIGAGVVVGLGTWFIPQPINRDSVHFGLALALGTATFLFGCLLCRVLFPKPDAVCPQCGCDWNVESENDVQVWLAWHCCPRCGLKMDNDFGEHGKP
jgi:hypothetical protein